MMPTSAKQDRIERRVGTFKAMIDAMRGNAITVSDAAERTGIGRSCARKYMRYLASAGIVHITASTKQSSSTLSYCYELKADNEAVRQFLFSMEVKPLVKSPPKPRSALAALNLDPTRHMHWMGGEPQSGMKAIKKIPAHEPVHAAFFGIGEAA